MTATTLQKTDRNCKKNNRKALIGALAKNSWHDLLNGKTPNKLDRSESSAYQTHRREDDSKWNQQEKKNQAACQVLKLNSLRKLSLKMRSSIIGKLK